MPYSEVLFNINTYLGKSENCLDSLFQTGLSFENCGARMREKQTHAHGSFNFGNVDGNTTVLLIFLLFHILILGYCLLIRVNY